MRILNLFLTIFLALSSFAQASKDFEYGPRPPLSVFDPTGFLNPKVAKEISDPLAKIYKNEHIDVLVVVLADLGDAPPEHVARRFADEWCTAGIHAVVLHVPGRKDSPWIIPGGKLVELLEPGQIQQAVEEAASRSAREVNEPDKVRAAATEAADMLRYWTNNLINHSETVRAERVKWRNQIEAKNRLWRIGKLVGAASILPLSLGISLIMLWFKRRGACYFPNRAWQFRLGAPHAGGNHAVVNFGPLPTDRS